MAADVEGNQWIGFAQIDQSRVACLKVRHDPDELGQPWSDPGRQDQDKRHEHHHAPLYHHRSRVA
jgi:hypothetical protein